VLLQTSAGSTIKNGCCRQLLLQIDRLKFVNAESERMGPAMMIFASNKYDNTALHNDARM
jgi:hypothetical protein